MESDPPTAPLARYGVIETDIFCTQCHYNLHGQVVTMDDRLAFLVCRCPECGKFQPAGASVSASTLWVRRLASILLFAWITIVITATFTALAGFSALSTSSVEAFSFEKVVPTTVNLYRFQMQLHDWRSPTTPDINGFETMMYICSGSFIIGFTAGALCVTLLWHWQRWRYMYVILLPVISAGFLTAVYRSLVNYDLIRWQIEQHILSQTVIQCFGILVGVVIGRPIAKNSGQNDRTTQASTIVGVSLASGWKEFARTLGLHHIGRRCRNSISDTRNHFTYLGF